MAWSSFCPEAASVPHTAVQPQPSADSSRLCIKLAVSLPAQAPQFFSYCTLIKMLCQERSTAITTPFYHHVDLAHPLLSKIYTAIPKRMSVGLIL